MKFFKKIFFILMTTCGCVFCDLDFRIFERNLAGHTCHFLHCDIRDIDFNHGEFE